VVEEMRHVFFFHPVSEMRRFTVKAPSDALWIRTDPSLLSRILVNMLKNAFEATDPGEEVRFSVESKNGMVSFNVWNRTSMPETVALRVFQRHFSTKHGSGRGFGTYSMKFFGEDILGGNVDFTTSKDEGTLFRFTIPQKM
jgi:signal transduction histidine kinase